MDTATFKEIESGEGKAASKLLRFTLDSIGKTEWPGGSPPADWTDFVNGYNAMAAKDETGEIKPMDPNIPPGRDIKCIVSVSMLTEGWDANTVTHIAGLRPFGSQLLCEQVIGRALRRQCYDVNEETGLLSEETATVFGVPFELVPFKTNVVKPNEAPREMNRIFTVQEKEDYRITAPNVRGFVPMGDFDVDVDWGSVPKQSFSDVRETTEIAPLPSGSGGAGDVMSLDEVRRNYRRQQVAFILAKNVCDRFMALEKNSDGHITIEALFPKVLPHAIRYLDGKIILKETEDVRDIVIYASRNGQGGPCADRRHAPGRGRGEGDGEDPREAGHDDQHGRCRLSVTAANAGCEAVPSERHAHRLQSRGGCGHGAGHAPRREALGEERREGSRPAYPLLEHQGEQVRIHARLRGGHRQGHQRDRGDEGDRGQPRPLQAEGRRALGQGGDQHEVAWPMGIHHGEERG